MRRCVGAQLVDLVARAGPNSASPIVARAIEDDPAAASAKSTKTCAPPRRGRLRRSRCRSPCSIFRFGSGCRSRAPVLAAASLDAGPVARLAGSRGRRDQPLRRNASSRASARACHRLGRGLSGPAAPTGRGHHQQRPTSRSTSPSPMSKRREQPPTGPARPCTTGRTDRAPPARPPGQARERRGEGAAPGASSLFRWECGPSGEIAWVEGAPRGPLIGRSIARREESDGDRVDPGRRARLRTARAVPRCRVDRGRRRSGRGRMADQRRAGIRARRRPLRRLSRGRAARSSGGASSRTGCRATCSPTRIRCASWSMRSRPRSTRSSASPRSSTASISGPPTTAIASARRRSSARRGCCSTAIDDLDFAAKVHSRAARASGRAPISAQLVERLAPSLRELAAPAASSSIARATDAGRAGARSSPSWPTG